VEIARERERERQRDRDREPERKTVSPSAVIFREKNGCTQL
jgi:hypothetical protein